ncbi:MAG: EAL domain-containing protein [Parvularcula sp.]
MGYAAKFALDHVGIALDAAGQAMFEMAHQNPNEVVWSDPETVARLFKQLDRDDLVSADKVFGLLSPEDALARESAILNARENGGSYCVEYSVGSGPNKSWIEERGMCLPQSDRLIGTVRSIDEQKTRERRLEYLANYDDLTGQLNRASFRDRLADLLVENAAEKRTSALLLVGIDALGRINNDFGFEVADQVIVEVADRIEGTLATGDVCGRVAGTKFGVLLRDGSTENILKSARSIMSKIRERIVSSDSGNVPVSVCVGAIVLDDKIASSGMAITCGEAAFDQARRKGPSSFELFSEKTETTSRRQQNTRMTDVILSALNQRSIYLAYQPIVSDVNSPHTKYECLIRMRADDGSEIPAPSFIPAAERLGLVHLLDRRVLELATKGLSRNPDIVLNVNLSWETVRDPVWAEGYIAHLRANRRVCDRLTIELTETQVVDAIEASKEFVSAIKELGCQFAIDDFGAGYTSFRNLKALDIDVLKIDGSFVSGVSSSRDNQLFVRTLLDLARNFGMKTVAEWVDNDADAMLLKALGVDYLQGYFIGKPEARPEWDAPEKIVTRAAG